VFRVALATNSLLLSYEVLSDSFQNCIISNSMLSDEPKIQMAEIRRKNKRTASNLTSYYCKSITTNLYPTITVTFASVNI
jgi:hypothetical protein